MELRNEVVFEIEDDEIIEVVTNSAVFERAIEQSVENALERQDPPDVTQEIERAIDAYDPAETLLQNKEFIRALAKEIVGILTATIELGVQGDAEGE